MLRDGKIVYLCFINMINRLCTEFEMKNKTGKMIGSIMANIQDETVTLRPCHNFFTNNYTITSYKHGNTWK
jgi:hypothetical protein